MEFIDMTAGPSYRQIIDVNNWQNSLFIHPIGQSGNLFSHYYDNYLSLWKDGKYINMLTINYPIGKTTTLLPTPSKPAQ